MWTRTVWPTWPRLYSPVPGGVGPLTVYCLLENLLCLAREAQGG